MLVFVLVGAAGRPQHAVTEYEIPAVGIDGDPCGHLQGHGIDPADHALAVACVAARHPERPGAISDVELAGAGEAGPDAGGHLERGHIDAVERAVAAIGGPQIAPHNHHGTARLAHDDLPELAGRRPVFDAVLVVDPDGVVDRVDFGKIRVARHRNDLRGGLLGAGWGAGAQKKQRNRPELLHIRPLRIACVAPLVNINSEMLLEDTVNPLHRNAVARQGSHG